MSYNLFCTSLKQVSGEACFGEISADSLTHGVAADIDVSRVKQLEDFLA